MSEDKNKYHDMTHIFEPEIFSGKNCLGGLGGEGGSLFLCKL